MPLRSTTRRLAAIDLDNGRPVWEKSYNNHCCDRLAVSPDGQTIYAPAFGSPQWYVVNAATGELRATIGAIGWPRQAAYSPDGQRAYLATWESNTLDVVAASHQVIKPWGRSPVFLSPLNARATSGVCERGRACGI
jgi:DNA-binding beta-propeller fold protein YncE